MSVDPVAALARRINEVVGPKGVVYLSGGGTEFLPMLLARGGGSASLLAARIPYAPEDFRATLGCDPGRLVDARAARALAMAAFRHALTIRGDLPPRLVFGIGSTSKLARGEGEGEREGRAHEIHAAVQTPGRTSCSSVTLPEGADRSWEERINALLLLNLLAEARGVADRVPLEHDGRALPTGSIADVSADAGTSGLQDLLIGRRSWVEIELSADQGQPGGEIPRLLLSGSFRPLHGGHVAMAEAASRMTGLPCGYEVSLFHPEKPPLDFLSIKARLGGFAGRHGRVFLTNAPTYLDKARLFPGCTFVVGHDTALRIINPRFYGGPAGRDAMLDELERLGARFLVFGRVDDSGSFHVFSPEEFEHPVSGFLARVARPVPAHVFRIDISSTEVRRRSGHDYD